MPTDEDEIIASKVALITCITLSCYHDIQLTPSDILQEKYGGTYEEREARANSVNKALVTAIDQYAVSSNIDQVKVAAAIRDVINNRAGIVGRAYSTLGAGAGVEGSAYGTLGAGARSVRNDPVGITVEAYAPGGTPEKVRINIKPEHNAAGMASGYIEFDHETALRFKRGLENAIDEIEDINH